ncbi:hypothetical protein [Streptomyces sp. NPDC056921]|uniref:hypothetical protein n=1 Tax=Streptomyces sp. NPDC056921 TaxID=3345966 RepID=UPI00363ADDA6
MTTIAKQSPPGIITGAAGYAHAGAWILGLAAAWDAASGIGDTHTDIAAAYVDRPAQAVPQALLVHGVAAACLAVVGSGVLSRARRSGSLTACVAGWAGIVVAALACVQLALELVAILGADPSSSRGGGALFETVLRTDGAKMLTLAMFAAATCTASRRDALLRLWEVVSGWALGAALSPRP